MNSSELPGRLQVGCKEWFKIANPKDTLALINTTELIKRTTEDLFTRDTAHTIWPYMFSDNSRAINHIKHGRTRISPTVIAVAKDLDWDSTDDAFTYVIGKTVAGEVTATFLKRKMRRGDFVGTENGAVIYVDPKIVAIEEAVPTLSGIVDQFADTKNFSSERRSDFDSIVTVLLAAGQQKSRGIEQLREKVARGNFPRK